MTERRGTPWYGGLLPGSDEPLSPVGEARIREQGEEWAQKGALAVEGARAAMGDLLAEISRLSPLVALMDVDDGGDEHGRRGQDSDARSPGERC
ncbi:hypothetical protein [Streptomyces chrestomyceticus]|uniref:hypothetical protein n=1 Tax=Streptomyces chrestomyceticus TaxID=68185 RepID=UPI0033CB9683